MNSLLMMPMGFCYTGVVLKNYVHANVRFCIIGVQWSVKDGHLNTLRPRQNGCHFADDIFKRIFLNENIWIPIKISLKFVPNGSIKNIPALIQIMAWCRPCDKPLSEPMMVNLPTHICVTRPQWVKHLCRNWCILKTLNAYFTISAPRHELFYFSILTRMVT